MANHSMQGPFSPGSVPHSPAGPPGLVMAGPMPHPEFMHPAMGAGGQYIPIPMQVLLVPSTPWPPCRIDLSAPCISTCSNCSLITPSEPSKS